MPKLHDLPPPLTRKSSKREMWENIEALETEIDAQQAEIRQLKEERDAAIGHREFLRYQFDMIRAVLAKTVVPPPG